MRKADSTTRINIELTRDGVRRQPPAMNWFLALPRRRARWVLVALLSAGALALAITTESSSAGTAGLSECTRSALEHAIATAESGGGSGTVTFGCSGTIQIGPS